MTSPIDTAVVEIRPDTSRFAPELNAELGLAFDELSNEVSDVVHNIEREFASLAGDISASFDAMAASVDEAFVEMRLGADHELNQIEDQAQHTTTRIGGLFASMAGVARGALFGIATGLGAAAGFGLKAAANFEQVQVALSALTGSAAAGLAQFKQLQTFAAVTPFEFSDLTTSAERFDAFSAAIGQSKAQLVPFLTTIGNLVSETGGGAQALDSITLAMGQTASQGKLTLGNLDQINNALPGFSAVAAIAAVRGQTTAQVMQEISSGSIDARTGLNQLLEGMQRFPGAAGAMAKQSQTLLGVFSTFKDTVSQSLSNAFQPVIPAIKDSLTQITPIIGDTIKEIAPALGQLLAGLLPLLAKALQAVTALVAPILSALGPALKSIGPALDAIGKAFGSVAEAIAPIIPVLAELISALVTGFAPILKALTPILFTGAKLLVALFKPLIPVIEEVGKVLSDTLGPILDDIGGLITDMTPELSALVEALAEAFMPILQALGPIILQLWDAFKPLLPAIVSLIKPVTDLIIALTPMIDIVAQLTVLLVKIIAPIIGFVSEIVSAQTMGEIVPILDAIFKAFGAVEKILDALITTLLHLDWGKIASIIGGAFEDAGKAVGHWIANFVTKDIPNFFTHTIPDALGRWTSGAGHWLYDVGRDMINGLIGGIESMVSSAINSVENALGNVVDAAKNFLGISSPSKIFMEIGHNVVAGYTKGVDDPPDDPRSAMLSTLGRAVPRPGDLAPQPNVSHAMHEGQPLFGPGSIVVQFSGVTPSPQEAFATGQAVGAGIASRLATRDTVNGVRTL